MNNKRILVVDDEKDFCDFLTNYLVGHEHIVDVAYDGAQAKDLLEKVKYDYIFFDCNMPELTGIELIKVIKKTNPNARSVMVSGYDLVEESFVKDLGVDIFLKKPISLETIKEIVQSG